MHSNGEKHPWRRKRDILELAVGSTDQEAFCVRREESVRISCPNGQVGGLVGSRDRAGLVNKL